MNDYEDLYQSLNELENYLRERAQGIYRPLPEGYQEHPMILHLGPQVEADEWPEIVE